VAYPKGLLAPGENVVLDLHPHWKRIAMPILLMPVIVGLGSFVAAVVPDGSAQAGLRYAILAVCVLLLIWFCLRPYLTWQFTHYVVTNRRIVHREGVITRSGRDVPLNRVNDVSFQHGPIDRIFGAGTLTIESAGERGQVVLSDVPRVEKVQHTLYDLVQAEEARQNQASRNGGAPSGTPTEA
jgi:membrane protein YdbS with pleckstrin-like domain